jgi:hypothetical protein
MENEIQAYKSEKKKQQKNNKDICFCLIIGGLN